MSKIADLRNSERNKINLISIIETFVKETKYIVMYQKLYSEMIQRQFSIVVTKKSIMKFLPEVNQESLDKLSDMEIIFMYQLMSQILPIKVNKDFALFCQYNDKNKIQNKDLQGYCTFEEIGDQVKIVKDKEEEKLLEKQVVKILDNDDWLILKPLTYKASLKYGASTKWCTASTDSKKYFDTYTSNGLLIYIINKCNKNKFAIHRKLSTKETTYWDAADNPMDIFEMNLDLKAYEILKKEMTSSMSNKKVFNELFRDDVPIAVTKPKNTYKSKSQLLDEVKKQYNNNDRWLNYLQTMDRRDNTIFNVPKNKKYKL